MALIVAIVFTVGCAAESKVLRTDPAFTAQSLREGGLAVLGVVQVDEVTQARPPLIAALEGVLAGARADIPLVRADRARAAIGDSAARLLLLGYQLRGVPDSLWLARAAEAVGALARYGVLARVEAASIRYGTRVVPSRDPTHEGDREVRVTGRDARVAVTIYDLKTRSVVYGVKLIGAADVAPDFKPATADSGAAALPPPREEPRPVRMGSNGYPIPGPSDSPEALGYPEAPAVARAAENAFLTLARQLPGAPAP